MKIQRCTQLSGRLILVGSVALVVVAAVTVSTSATAQSDALQATETSATVIEEGVAGGAVIVIVELSAQVVAVDTETRTLTLQDSNGEKHTITVGPEAGNFEQIEVGDVVKASVTEELVVGILPEHAAAPQGAAVKALGYVETDDVEAMPDGTTGIVAHAAKSSQPGGLIATTTQFTATVAAIDEENRTATLRTDDGRTRTILVRDDIDLSKHKVGERVVFHATEKIAISLEKT